MTGLETSKVDDRPRDPSGKIRVFVIRPTVAALADAIAGVVPTPSPFEVGRGKDAAVKMQRAFKAHRKALRADPVPSR